MAQHLRLMREINDMTGPELLAICNIVTADMRNQIYAAEKTREAATDTEQSNRARDAITEYGDLIAELDSLRNDIVAGLAHDFIGNA
jgi:hypothetical protein